MTQNPSEFLRKQLVPAACQSLYLYFQRHKNDQDIGIEIKGDNTPASEADRHTEKLLRHLIHRDFPDHGIFGEEYGIEKPDAEYVWVLDPLDGTREFLAKKEGKFGCLIGLFKNGKAYDGVIANPSEYEVIYAKDDFTSDVTSLEGARLCCTNPEGMFAGTKHEAGMKKIEQSVKDVIIEMNCVGFSMILSGKTDIAIERDLGLYDIAAIISVLTMSGCSVIDFDGNDYKDMVFDIEASRDKKFDIIAAANKDLATQAYEMLKNE